MKISDIMTRGVQTVTPDQSIHEAAALMARIDCGALFVNEQDHLIGVVTDRDIATRAVAEGLPGDTPVSEVMSQGVRYCFQDEDVMHVAKNMADIHVRRLPVMDRDKRLVGVVSLGNIAASDNNRACATVLHGVAQAH
nr:CBS domain-containing protein [uncultured Pseudomonas sp.]